MNENDRLYARIVRRETTSPRSTIAIVLAIVIALLCAYAIVETILHMIGEAPLLASPPSMADALVAAPSYVAGAVIAAGAAAAVLGLWLVIVSLTPGRRPRHVIQTERTATVVDDEVIASSIARHASYEGNVDPDNARVSVSRRRATVELVTGSGRSVDRESVSTAVSRQLEAYGVSPTLSSRISVRTAGKVGA